MTYQYKESRREERLEHKKCNTQSHNCYWNPSYWPWNRILASEKKIKEKHKHRYFLQIWENGLNIYQTVI